MKKIIKLAKSRRKSQLSTDDDAAQPSQERRKSTFSFISQISSDFHSSKPDLRQGDEGVRTIGGYRVDLNSSSDISFTKLHKACWLGNLEKVKKHVRRNDVNLQDNDNRAPLHYASVIGNIDIITYLFECNANFNLRDGDGRTPYLKAIECNHRHLIKFMLDCGTDIKIADHEDMSGVHLAVMTNEVDTVKAILQYGGNPDYQNKNGATALHMACSNSINPAIVYMLLLHGAAINTLDSNMRTCLMLACQSGCMDVVKVLLDNNADVSSKDDRGLSAEDYALMAGHNEIATLLASDAFATDLATSPIDDVIFDGGKATDLGEDFKHDIDSWNDSADDFSQQSNDHPAINIIIPSLKLSDLIEPSSGDDEELSEAKAALQNDVNEEKAIKVDEQFGDQPITDKVVEENAKSSESPAVSPSSKSSDKRKMSIVLGLVDDDDDDEDFDASAEEEKSSEINFDSESADDAAGSSYVPTLVEHSVVSPVETTPQNQLIPPESKPGARLYKKHARTGSNISVASRLSASKKSTDSDWDSEPESESDATKLPNAAEMDSKEGTLGRFGTMAGVDEVWHNNPSMPKTAVDSESNERENKMAAESTTSPKKQPKEEVPEEVHEEELFLKKSFEMPSEERRRSNSFLEMSDPSSISTIACEDAKTDDFGKFEFPFEQKRKNSYLEMPSKLTFRRKSLDPEQTKENSKPKQPQLTKSGSMDLGDSEVEGGLMRKISLTNCNENYLRADGVSENVSPRSVSPEAEGSSAAKQAKRRFSLSGGLKSRRKSVADWERQNEGLDLIPEDECNESDTQKKNANRKQFRCFKVSPGESSGKESTRRASIAIGESKPTTLSSRTVMQTISRRLSLSSPDSDVNAINSPEPPSSDPSDKKANGVSSPPRAKTPEDPPSTKTLDGPPKESKPMLIEDISSATLSDMELLEDGNSDGETDYFDQTDNLSVSSSEDEQSEGNGLHLHQAQHEPASEDLLRQLRIALEKEIAEKKALQGRVRQLQKDRVKYLKKMDSDASHVNTLNRTVMEAESKCKSLEFQIFEERDKTENERLLLEKVKEQLAAKDRQYIEEMKGKESALQQVKLLQDDLDNEKVSRQNDVSDEVLQEQRAKNLILEEKITKFQDKLMDRESVIEKLKSERQLEQSSYESSQIENASIADEFEKEKANWQRIQKELMSSNDEALRDLKDARDEKKTVEEALDKACLDYASKIQQLTNDKNEVVAKMTLMEQTVAKLQSKDDTSLKEIESLKAELEKSRLLKDKVDDLKDQVRDAESKNAILESQLKVVEASKVSRDAGDNQMLVNHINEKIDLLKLSLENVKDENSKSNLEICESLKKNPIDDSLQVEWNNLLQEMQGGHSDILAKMTQQCSLLEVNVKSLEQQLEQAALQKTDYEEVTKKHDEAAADYRQQILNLQKEVEALNVERTYLQKDLGSAEQRLKSVDATNEDLKRSEAKLSRKCEQLENEAEDARTELRTKNDGISKWKETELQNVRLQEKISDYENRAANFEKKLNEASAAKDNADRTIGDLQGRIACLETNLRDERMNHSLYKNEASNHQDLWESEVKTKSMLGLKLTELEHRCQKYDEDLKHERLNIAQIKNERQELNSQLQTEAKSSLKLKESFMLVKTHLKVAKKRIKQLESEPAEAEVKRLKAKVEEEKMASQELIKKHERKTEQQEQEIGRLEQQIGRLQAQASLVEEELRERELLLKRLEFRLDSKRESQLLASLDKASFDYVAKPTTDSSNPVSPNKQVPSQNDGVGADIGAHLARINAHLEEQAKNQRTIDSMRAENENRLRDELNDTRTSMADELANVKATLDKKIDELRAAQFENMLLKSTRPNASFFNANETTFSPRVPSPVPILENGVYVSSSARNNDGYSHVLGQQLEQTIRHHIISDPEVTLDVPDRNMNSLSPGGASTSDLVNSLRKKYFL